MPTDYDIGAAFAAIEGELIASMLRNLQRHRAEETKEGFQWSQWQAEQLDALESYKRQNQKKYGKQFRSINRKLEEAIRAACAEGEMEQEEEILGAIRAGFSARRMDGALSGSFFRLNERKLNALIKATTDDMEQAEIAVLRRANDQYRKIIYNAQVCANTGAGTYEKAVDMATKDFLSAGIQCVVYKNGARHTLSDYADMALRTASKRAYLQGEGAKRQEWGISTVIINKRNGACPDCARFCGKVFIDDVWSGGKRSDGNYPLLSKAIEQGLYHPRCKDSHSTYFPELYEDEKPYTKAEIAELEGRERQEQRRQHAQRQAERYRRLEEFSLDEENRRKYGQRAREWESITGATGGQSGLVEYQVTDEVIQGLPRVRASGWSDKQAAALQDAHKQLLTQVKRQPIGTEAGMLLNMDGHVISSIEGAAGSVLAKQPDIPHMFLHNHPDGQIFSHTDIESFIFRDSTMVLTAVGNNGKIFMLVKSNNYDGFHFRLAYLKAQMDVDTAVRRGDPTAYVARIRELLEEAKAYGVEFVES